MQATIDDQGRIQIPPELREKLHLVAGVVVDLQPAEKGLRIVPAAPKSDSSEAKLVWENGLLVIQTPHEITVDDVNEAIERTRQERIDRNMGIETTDR